ncbi:uncharacterized protein [Rhodnius prolixus]
MLKVVCNDHDLSFYGINEAAHGLVKILLLAYVCENFHGNAEQFNVKLHNLLKKYEHYRNEQLIFYCLKDRNENFMAGGFIKLGYPFIASVLATVVTYEIVIFQFTPCK